MAIGLLDTSHELLHNILIYVLPGDLAALRQTCSALDAYIRDNRLLYKELYLSNWVGRYHSSQGITGKSFVDDDQDHPSGDREVHWQDKLQQAVTLQRILECEDVEKKRESLETAANAIDSMMQTSTSHLNVPFLAAHFSSQANIDAFLASSSLFRHAGTTSQNPAATESLRQLSAKLHCLYGVPIDSRTSSSYMRDGFSDGRSSFQILTPSRPSSALDFSENSRVTRSQTINIPTNTYARSKIYDLRQYTDESLWGPFKDDWSQDVDWEKVEAIMVVLGYNLRIFRQRARFDVDPVWETPWQGAQPHSFVSPSSGAKMVKELGSPGKLDAQDPYGISGMWMRVVCFLDYHDLYAFNFARPPPAGDQPREPIDTREAIRMIKLKLRVTKIEPPGIGDGKDYPVVSFKGTSWSLHASWDPNANSMIRGTVRQTPQGEIRWTTWSIFHGEERWRSEGVQIGGPRSARGVLGNWFDKDYDVHGPAGPTAFWKIKDVDDEDEGDRPASPPISHHMLAILSAGLGGGATDDDDDESEDSDYNGDE